MRFERLSAQDNTFLVFETENSHLHVCGASIYEAGAFATELGGIDVATYRKATEAVLYRIPRYRQKLQYIPFINHPVWVDDPDFNLEYHIRHTALPRPGGMEELKQLVARIMDQPLDRSRPLWENWLVEGMEGDRFAVISKMHHCMIDGSSGMDLAQILNSPDPNAKLETAGQYLPREEPSGWELLSDDLLRRLRLPLDTLRSFQTFRRGTDDLLGEIGMRARSLAQLLGWAARPPSETPFNGSIGPHRRFDWLEMPLDDVKKVRRALGCSVNDVVLATVTGAVREFLLHRYVDPDGIDFRVSTPVSVRGEGEQGGKLGNRVSTWIVELPVGIDDPVKQLTAIHDITQELKESKQALGAEMIMAVAEWTPPFLLSLGARAGSAPIPVNMMVTNIPGPQFPLYLLGARMIASYPAVPLMENTGMAIALMSYDGKIFWGFNADYDLLPDLRDFVDAIDRSFAALARGAGVEVQDSERVGKPIRKPTRDRSKKKPRRKQKPPLTHP